ncbi:unnamed protein product [Bemisia tabaci]|uniref:Mitotic checkpoint serine/threonine-protein kinase BUB1 n=1 Tax=Bemisia tabaci TaxID=7038 RepID=A0A9P0F079_BEMTA|nr:unnamed protein product [Bemisia tabaci]
MDTTDALDLSKENIQPLKQGRKAVQLGTALQAQTNQELQQKLAAEREQYELLIRMYEGDDPLGPRYEYVSWIEQSYPKHGPESNLIPLLEDTLTRFKDDEKYKQDPRFVQLMIKYIDSLPNPLEIYQLVYSEGLGTKCALLYKSWADELDKNQDFKRANQIYQLGLKNQAEPFDDLQQAQIQFQLSVGRRMLGGGVNAQEDQPAADHSRQALSKLKKTVGSTRVSRVQPGTVMMNPLAQTQKLNVKSGGIQVYTDENCDPLSGLKKMNKVDHDLPKSATINKENKLAAGPWNKQGYGMKKHVPKAPSTPSFQVHQDPEALIPNREMMSQVPGALKTRKAETFSCPIAIFEPPDPTKKPMYCKDKIYAGTKEVQFEEIRAALYMKRRIEMQALEARSFNSTNGNSFGSSFAADNTHDSEKCSFREGFNCSGPKISDNNERGNMSNEFKGPGVYMDKPKLKANENKDPANRFGGGKMFPPDISINHQSFTINTREAMNVVAEMWKSPATSKPKFPEPKPAPASIEVYTDDDDFKVPAPVKPTKPAFSLYVDEEEEPANKAGGSKDAGLQFTVFTDEPAPAPEPKEPLKLPYIPSPHTQDPLQEADGKENNSPVDYTVSTEKRRLSGTLVPAADIPVMEENNDNEEENDNDQFLDRTNMTCNMTCNTKAFCFELPSSTPMTSNFKPRTPHSSQAINGSYLGDFNYPTTEQKKAMENDNLSMILEASKERYSSSSGSSASSGIRTLSSMYSCERRSLMTIRERESKSAFGKEMLEEEDVKDLQESIKYLEISLPEDINPFSEELIEKLLAKKIHFPRRHHEIGLCRIEGAVPVLKQSSTITLDDETYSIIGEIGKGSYARVVKATYGRQNVALKVQKPACPWEWYICKEIQHRLNSKNIAKGFMNPDTAFFFNNGSILVSEWAQYGSLLNIVNVNKVVTNKMLPLGVVLHLTIQILDIIDHLHSCKIIHGDVKPDNFVLRSGLSQSFEEPSIQLIDFGRSIDMTLLPEGTTFSTVVETDGFTCNEMKDGKRWTYQTDYFGIAGTVYLLIMAKYMQTVKINGVWNLSSAFPRYSRRDIWEPVFYKLLNVESCSDLPKLRDIINDLTKYFHETDSYLLRTQFSHLMNVLKKQ